MNQQSLLEKIQNSQSRLDIHYAKTDKPLCVLLILYQPSKIATTKHQPKKKELSVLGQQIKIKYIAICLMMTDIIKDDSSEYSIPQNTPLEIGIISQVLDQLRLRPTANLARQNVRCSIDRYPLSFQARHRAPIA